MNPARLLLAILCAVSAGCGGKSDEAVVIINRMRERLAAVESIQVATCMRVEKVKKPDEDCGSPRGSASGWLSINKHNKGRMDLVHYGFGHVQPTTLHLLSDGTQTACLFTSGTGTRTWKTPTEPGFFAATVSRFAKQGFDFDMDPLTTTTPTYGLGGKNDPVLGRPTLAAPQVLNGRPVHVIQYDSADTPVTLWIDQATDLPVRHDVLYKYLFAGTKVGGWIRVRKECVVTLGAKVDPEPAPASTDDPAWTPPFIACNGPFGLAFSPDGKTLAIGSRQAELWDAASRRRTATFPFTAPIIVQAVAFSPDGTLLAAGGYDYPADKAHPTADWIKVWDIRKGIELPPLEGNQDFANWLSFTPDVTRLISDKGKIWNVATGKQDEQPDPNTIYMTVSPDGTLLASETKESTIRILERNGGKLLGTITGADKVCRLAFSPDGSLILTSRSEPDRLTLWDVRTCKEVRTFATDAPIAFAIAFHPAGRVIVSGHDDGTLRLWDVESGKLLKSVAAHPTQVGQLAFRPDGEILASGSNYFVRLWTWKDLLAESSR